MSHQFRFNYFDLGQVAEFTPNQAIEFDPIMTGIIGTNGTGKTRLVRALRQHFVDCYRGFCELNPTAIDWLIFPDMKDIPSTGESWLPLQEWLSTQESLVAASGAVGELATRYWQTTMGPLDSRIIHLSVRVSTEGNIDVWMPQGKLSANQYYSGVSDRVILGICIRLAVRNFMRLNVPIVVDDIGWCLPSIRVDDLVRVLRIHSPQTIITSNTMHTMKTTGKLVLLRSEPEGVIVDTASLNQYVQTKLR